MPNIIDDVKRISKVVRVLFKYGLGDLVKKSGLSWHLSFIDRFKPTKKPKDLPKRLRCALEDLGGAYIKIGQLLSSRPDLIPQEYCDEFSKLLDETRPESFVKIKKIIEDELKQPLNRLFLHIDEVPLGSASIAQVHKAQLRNGQSVAVKVQKPEAKKQFLEDIDIMKFIARKIEKHIKNGIRPLRIIEEFENYTKKELDFKTEAENIEQIRIALKNDSDVEVPKVFKEWTTSRILTMQYLEGLKLTQVIKHISKEQRDKIIRTLIRTTIAQIFEKGVFHADLHIGNILLLKNKKVGLLDFGIVGKADKKTIESGIKLYNAITVKDTEAIVDVILDYGFASEATNIDNYIYDLNKLIKTEDSKSQVHQLRKLFEITAQNKIILPQEIILIGKAIVTIEATIKLLDSEFDFVKETKEDIAKILLKKQTPKKIIKDFLLHTKNITTILKDLPEEALETMKTLRRGQIQIELDDTHLKRIRNNLETTSNKISYSLIAASLILAGSILTTTPPFFKNYSVPSLISYLFAIIFIILLLGSILNKGGNEK